MRIIQITLVLLFSFTIISKAQEIDTRTKNQVKAKFMLAEDYFAQGNYTGAMEKIEESEALLNGAQLPTLLDLKIKTLIALERYLDAKDALFALEGLELNDAILSNIGSYTEKINEGIEAELKAKKQKIIENIYYRSLYYRYTAGTVDPPKTLLIEKRDGEDYTRPFDGHVEVTESTKALLINEGGLIESDIYRNSSIREYTGCRIYFKDLDFQTVNTWRGLESSYEWLVDHDGSEMFKNRFYSIEGGNSGFALASDGKNMKYVLNTKTGQIVLTGQSYTNSSILGHSEGMAKIGYDLCGFYNLNSGEKIEPKFSWAGYFSEGLAWVEYNGKNYVINRNGEFVLGPYDLAPNNNYTSNTPFKHGLSIMERNDNEFGVINNKGEMVLPFVQYSGFTAVKISDNGNIIVDKGVINKYRKIGLFNNQGKQLIDCEYEWISYYGGSHIRAYKELEGNRVTNITLFNNEGQQITNLIYESIGLCVENRMLAQFDGKFGYIDSTGTKVVDYEYESGKTYKDGLAPVKKNGKWGVIDVNGNEVLPFIYDDINYFFDDITFAVLNGEQVIIDKKGNVIY